MRLKMLAIGASCAMMSMAQATVIDFYESEGFGIASDMVQINNIRVDSEIENPFRPGEIQIVTIYYDVPFRFDLASLHLIPVLENAAAPATIPNCAELNIVATNAVTGEALPNAVVSINGMSATTTVEGFANIAGLLQGTFEVSISIPGYTSSDRVVTLNCEQAQTVSLSLNPTVGEHALQANEVRIISTWGTEPVDVDAHLTGPCPGLAASDINETDRFHVYWYNPEHCNGMVNLDVDDVTSYGPETVTISPPAGADILQEGIYRYTLYQYAGAGTLADTASVELIIGNSAPRIFTPPAVGRSTLTPGIEGNVWTVFELYVNPVGVVSVRTIDEYSQLTGSSTVRSGNSAEPAALLSNPRK